MAEGERAPAMIDLSELAQAGAEQGVVWARETEDLDVNVVAFPAGRGVGAHVNDEVDVLLMVVAGSGVVEIEGRPHHLSPGVMVLIPRGTRRALRSSAERLVYVTCHRRRPRLRPTTGPPRREATPLGDGAARAMADPDAGWTSPTMSRAWYGAPPSGSPGAS